MKNKILLIEDDIVLAESLKDFFEEENIDVISNADGLNTLKLYKQHRPDLILSDVKLPNRDGFEIIKEIRELDKQIPIIIMTGSEVTESSQIKGYEIGAINYILKPVIPQVLLAQINNLLHRNKTKTYQLNNYLISLDKRLLKVNEKEVVLREKEGRVMKILLENLNSICERETILTSVWGDDCFEHNAALDKIIYKLKETLSVFPNMQIKSVYAAGYMLTAKNDRNCLLNE